MRTRQQEITEKLKQRKKTHKKKQQLDSDGRGGRGGGGGGRGSRGGGCGTRARASILIRLLWWGIFTSTRMSSFGEVKSSKTVYQFSSRLNLLSNTFTKMYIGKTLESHFLGIYWRLRHETLDIRYLLRSQGEQIHFFYVRPLFIFSLGDKFWCSEKPSGRLLVDFMPCLTRVIFGTFYFLFLQSSPFWKGFYSKRKKMLLRRTAKTRKRRLIFVFAGRTCNLVGNAVPQLIFYLIYSCHWNFICVLWKLHWWLADKED